MIRTTTGRTDVASVTCDLASSRAVVDVAKALRELLDRVDLLINNAGAIYHRRMETSEGVERTFALNVLAPFALTHRIWPLLAAGAPARVVMVGSAAHLGARLDLNDLQGERHYSGWGAYRRSKLGLLLITHELARRAGKSRVTVNAVHPGFVRSGFGRNNTGAFAWAIRAASVLAISAERGADTPFYVATAPELEGVTGAYFVRNRAVPSSSASYEREVGRALWAVCERLAGTVPFGPDPDVGAPTTGLGA